MNIYTALMAVVGLLLVLYTPVDFARYVPSPLVSMISVTIIQYVFQFPNVATIESAL